MALVPGTPPEWFIDEMRIDFLEKENKRLRVEREQLRVALEVMRKDYDLLKQLAK